MAKISRPAVYTFVGAVAVYAVVLLTQPDAPVARRKTHELRHATTQADAWTQADLTAHFARYAGGKRNPFWSALPAAQAAGAPGGKGGRNPAPPGGPGQWALTGINVINGAPVALVENGVSGESVFLKVGDHWRGLRVLSIGTEAVTFLNMLGQQTFLAFRSPDDPAPGASASAASRLPGLNAGGPLLAMPIAPGSIRPLPVLPPSGSPSPSRGR